MINITVRIGNEARKLADASKDWINQQINRRREHGEAVCVQVTIIAPDVHVTLSTPTCGGGFGGRAPNRAEAAIIELWDRRGLNDPGFTGGGLTAFLEQLQRLL